MPGQPQRARSFAGGPIPLADEPSGSLTGHILAQGWPDTPAFDSGRRRWVIGILLLIALVVVGGLTVAVLVLSGTF